MHWQVAKAHKGSNGKYLHALLAKVTNKSGACAAANSVFISHANNMGPLIT
jgi:hypothetical protein